MPSNYFLFRNVSASKTVHSLPLPKSIFNQHPDPKHTKTCNGADELAFGNLGRCLGSL